MEPGALTAGMNRHAHNIVLFLDTPRAEGELNHRFFVASPDDCDERQIVRYAGAARANLTGEDYLAVSRPVAQVSRGQTRTGLELLVLAGITTGDPSQTAQLREKLNAMLHSFQDTSFPVDTDSSGLLIPNRRIAELQQQLSAELAPGSAIVPKRARPGVLPILKFGTMLVLLVVVAVSIGLVLALKKKSGGNSQQSGESPESPNDGKNDWEFLSNDPSWKQLAQLTGLRPDRKLAAANLWAESLMKAADPNWDAQQRASPERLKENTEVRRLLEAVSSAASSDAKLVSEKWLFLRGRDAESLLGFWKDIKTLNAAALKQLLHDWEGALVSLSKSNGSDIPPDLRNELTDFAKKVLALPDKVAPGIQILVETDLLRFLSITKIMDGNPFAEAVKSSELGTDWTSRTWDVRLKRLAELSTSPKLSDGLQKFFKTLNGSIGR